ncbi:hypothetical protein QBC45DRAFT_415290 [Copromyces sp. CBS 386.78]|nr:hypothetical protein QBC45DRAFT_415290 [Copromyces sp. CBS 386.78]
MTSPPIFPSILFLFSIVLSASPFVPQAVVRQQDVMACAQAPVSSAVALYCAHLAVHESTLTMLPRDHIFFPQAWSMETPGRGLTVEQDLTRPYSKTVDEILTDTTAADS